MYTPWTWPFDLKLEWLHDRYIRGVLSPVA